MLSYRSKNVNRFFKMEYNGSYHAVVIQVEHATKVGEGITEIKLQKMRAKFKCQDHKLERQGGQASMNVFILKVCV